MTGFNNFIKSSKEVNFSVNAKLFVVAKLKWRFCVLGLPISSAQVGDCLGTYFEHLSQSDGRI
jgi:hypothetical protein